MKYPRTSNSNIVPMLYTTAGVLERESKSRRYNLLEALGMMVFILVLLWPVGFGVGVLGEQPWAETLSIVLIVLGALYILFVSPFVHKDTLDSWGLGNPRTLWRLLRSGKTLHRSMLWEVVIGLMLGLNCLNYLAWPDVSHFFRFDHVAAFFGYPHVQPDTWPQQFPGLLFVLGFGGVLSVILVAFCIRYDNFYPAFCTAMKVSLPLLGLIFLGAYLHRGMAAFSDFSLQMWVLNVFGYIFWGFVQQLLFSAYFGGRFRKAFAPSASLHNIVAENRRPIVAIGFGAGSALLTTGCAFWMAGGLQNGAEGRFFGWLALFVFVVGTAYGYVYCLDKKRMLVSTLCAGCFGLIHIDSYGLVAVTWGLGIVLVYVFMVEKNRNLVALGFIHGLLGASFGELFSHKASGALRVNYGVGPWNIKEPTATGLIVPCVCIAAYVVLMIWAFRNLKEKPGTRTR